MWLTNNRFKSQTNFWWILRPRGKRSWPWLSRWKMLMRWQCSVTLTPSQFSSLYMSILIRPCRPLDQHSRRTSTEDLIYPTVGELFSSVWVSSIRSFKSEESSGPWDGISDTSSMTLISILASRCFRTLSLKQKLFHGTLYCSWLVSLIMVEELQMTTIGSC